MPIYFEHDLVPYETSPLPPGPWLVLAPHPDDEAFGMGGTLLLARQHGIPVEIVFVTRGERGGDPEVRTQEALKAAALLKVRKIHFLDLPDRGVYKNLDVLTLKIKKFFAQKFETIFAPSFLEFHPDHRAVSLVTASMAPCWKRVWLYEITRQGEANRLIDISPVFSEKEKLMACYASQIKMQPFLDIVRALNKTRTYTLKGVSFAEGFFAARGGLLTYRFASWLKRYFSFP